MGKCVQGGGKGGCLQEGRKKHLRKGIRKHVREDKGSFYGKE